MNSSKTKIAISVAMLYGIYSMLQYANRWFIERERSKFQSYTVKTVYFSGVPQDDGSTHIQIIDYVSGEKIATVAIFAPTLEIARRHHIDEGYLFFKREDETRGIELPLYHQVDQYQVGDFHSLKPREQHHGGLMLPIGFSPDCKFYYDCRNFAAVKLPSST